MSSGFKDLFAILEMYVYYDNDNYFQLNGGEYL